MPRKALPLLALLILLGALLPAPAGLAGPPAQQMPEPFPFTDRYPAEVVLTTAEMLGRLASFDVDVAALRPLDPAGTFPRPGEPFVPLLATVHVNAGEAARLATAGLIAQPIDNPSVPDFPGGPTACSDWPSYAAFVARMQNLASANPALVRLYDVGNTVQGRDLWVLKITDNPDLEEDEPEFRYSSTLHGKEGAGAEMTLRLAELLVSSYGTVPTLTQMVDEMEIWLWPISNPDGYEVCSYYNAHGVNLNRDFPDRFDVPPVNSPDGREPETQAAWYFQEAHTIVMGANYHSGALVANLPWDAITPPAAPEQTYAPDDAAFIQFAEGYTWRNQSLWNGGWYHGWTRGWEWYQIWGGLQDWAYHWYGEHHITLEISNSQPPPYSQMDAYWDDNRAAMLWWMGRTLTGARGLVTDACTGAPLDASVDVLEIGKAVPTDPDVGDYHRLLLPGTYTLVASAAGYPSQSATVTVVDGPATVHDFALASGSLYTVQGTVTEAGSGLPLAATVEVLGTALAVDTDPATGHYALELCPGTYTLRASAPYHQAEERVVEVTGNRTEDFTLSGYAVAAGSSARAAALGETLTHTLAVTNVGSLTDTYSLTLVPGAWPAELVQDTLGPLAPGASAPAHVVVHVPEAPLSGTVLLSDTFALLVTSTAAPGAGAQGSGTTTVVFHPDLAMAAALDHLGAPAGRAVTYTLVLTNTGETTDAVALAAEGNSWPTVLPFTSVSLDPGEAVPLLVRVEIPRATALLTDTVAVVATSGWDGSVRVTVTLTTTRYEAGILATDSNVAGRPGETVTHTLTITNSGPASDTFQLALAPGAWPTALAGEPTVGPLAPGEAGTVQVVVEIPHLLLTPTVLLSDTFALAITSTVVPAVSERAAGVTAAVADLAVQLVADRATALGRPGEVVTYTLTITNAGAYTDSYALTLLPGSAWPAGLTPAATPPLAPGARTTAWLRVTVPGGPGGAGDVLTVRARSSWSPAVAAEEGVIAYRSWCIWVPLVVK